MLLNAKVGLAIFFKYASYEHIGINFVRQIDGNILMHHFNMLAYIILFNLKEYHIAGPFVKWTILLFLLNTMVTFIFAAIFNSPVSIIYNTWVYVFIRFMIEYEKKQHL